jgi:hypothetical protein
MLRNEKWVNHFLDSAQWPDSRMVMMPKTSHSPGQGSRLAGVDET